MVIDVVEGNASPPGAAVAEAGLVGAFSGEAISLAHRLLLCVHRNIQCKCRISSDLVGIYVLNSGAEGSIIFKNKKDL